MRYYSNLDCAKAFVKGDCYFGKCNNVSFNNDEFYSYKTCIAKKVQCSGQEVLLVSMKNFSSTTTKHISAIAYSFFHEDNNLDSLVYVPFHYYDEDVSLFTLADRFYKAVDSYRKCDFHFKKERQEFAILYHRAESFSDKVLCLDFLNEFWVQSMVNKIRWIEDYKDSKISNYRKVNI